MPAFLNTLQLRLNAAFSLLFLLLAVLAGGFAFYDTYRETNDFQDELLKQTAAYVNPNAPPPKMPDVDNDVRIYVDYPGERMGDGDGRHLNLPEYLADGLHTVYEDGDSYRVFVRSTPQGRVAVWQENEYREELAARSAWSSVLPLLLLIPLISLLTMWVVRRTLRPVSELSAHVEARGSQDLSPLPQAGIPREIRGFVQALNRLLARIEAAVQQQQRFIADAAHELRSPMTALSLQAERLAQQPLPAPAAEQLAALQQGIRRNRQLLAQLLSHARAQNSEAADRPSAIHAQALFRRVVEDLLPLAEAKGQDLGVADSADPVFYADETALYTLLKTLADNAIRYTPSGGQIDLSAEETATHIVLHIEDNGPGIAPSERQRVLDPFYRILGSGEEGTGLGLSIAEAVAQRYGGRLVLDDSRRFDSGLHVAVYLDKRFLQA